MFGNKKAKQERLQRMAKALEQAEDSLSQSALARRVGMPRATVKRDLPTLEDEGILLAEDERGWLSFFGWRK